MRALIVAAVVVSIAGCESEETRRSREAATEAANTAARANGEAQDREHRERMQAAERAAAELDARIRRSPMARWVLETKINTELILMISVSAEAWLRMDPVQRKRTVVAFQTMWAGANQAECGSDPIMCQVWLYDTVGLRPERVAWTDALGGVHISE